MRNQIFIITCFMIFMFSMHSVSFSAEEKNSYKIGVNRFAWYASLKLINFMPLISADPFSGVIITDWYSLDSNTKYKVDVYILEENLTSHTVEVKLFKQVKTPNGWTNSNISKEMSSKLEDAILNTARQLRIQYMLGEK